MKNNFLLIVSLVLILASCKKDDAASSSYDTNVKAPVSIEFDNVAGNQDLVLNSVYYTTANGDSIKPTLLKYFVSNFVFTDANNNVYTVPQDSCYKLLSEKDSITDVDFNIPEGEYKKVEFIIGVDSLRNTLDVSKRTGDLDPAGAASGMYWTWNSGYIFFKLEGVTPSNKTCMYHIGLFGGKTTPTLNNIKKISIDLASKGSAIVKTGKSPEAHLFVDILKAFGTPTSNTVKISQYPVIMTDSASATVAANFPSMITLDHIHPN